MATFLIFNQKIMHYQNKKLYLREVLYLCQKRLSERKFLRSKYDWCAHARQSQLIPEGDWRIWLILAGRGFGKTRTGAETIRHWATSGEYKRIGLIANSLNDARTVMIEGESGILTVSPSWEVVTYEPSNQILRWRKTGAIAQVFSAQNPEKLRGPQFDAIWIDELAKFKNASKVLEQVSFALRLGKAPKMLITTTPKPTKAIKSLIKRDEIVITRGNTFENSLNLAPQYIEQMKQKYSGTKIGAQELYAEIIDDNPQALWSWEMIEQSHTPPYEIIPEKIVIGIDPAVTSNENSDETGIIVAGIDANGYILIMHDASCKAPPEAWSQTVIELYETYHANSIVAEVNAGGDLVEQVLRSKTPYINIKKVRATNAKLVRAEPVAILYKMNRIFHQYPFTELEKQMTSFCAKSGDKSPDRLDALVWAVTELIKNHSTKQTLNAWNI